MSTSTVINILPLSFTKDFKPERRLLSQILHFTKNHGKGDKHEISDLTGIPTGKSSGKVEPTIYYAIGMGLILANRSQGRWSLKLTALGQLVLDEDPYLSEEVSLWLIHLMLSRPLVDKKESRVGVVGPWFNLFSLSQTRLGSSFTASEYEQFIEESFGANTSRKKICSVTLNSYEEDSCLGLTKALLLKDNKKYERQHAPLDREFYPAYTAYFFLLWDEFFPNENQLSLSDFFKMTRMLQVMYWTQQEAKSWTDWMVDQSMFQLDRQTGGTLALRTVDTEYVLQQIYSELI